MRQARCGKEGEVGGKWGGSGGGGAEGRDFGLALRPSSSCSI